MLIAQPQRCDSTPVMSAGLSESQWEKEKGGESMLTPSTPQPGNAMWVPLTLFNLARTRHMAPA